MADIIDNQTTQVNFVLVPRARTDLGSLPVGQLEAKMKTIYGDTSKPVLTKFPDVFVMFDPTNQASVSALADQNRVIVSDNRVTPFSGRELEKFVALSRGVAELILGSGEVKAYGINIMSSVDLDQPDSAKFMLDHFIKGVGGIEVSGGGIDLIYTGNGFRNYLRLEPRFEGPSNAPTKSVQVNQNSHTDVRSLPNLEDLRLKVTGVYSSLPTFLGRLFT